MSVPCRRSRRSCSFVVSRAFVQAPAGARRTTAKRASGWSRERPSASAARAPGAPGAPALPCSALALCSGGGASTDCSVCAACTQRTRRPLSPDRPTFPVKDGGLERYKMNVYSERLPSRLLNSTNHRLKPDNSPHQQLREPSPESPATLTSSHPEHPQVSSTMTQALTDDFQYAPPPKLANPGPLGEYRGTPLARQWCC